MKTIMKLVIVATMAFIAINSGFSGITIGGDIYFTTSLKYDTTNAVVTNAYNDWIFNNTYLYVGLYPTFVDKGIKGDVRIFINSTNATTIYYGGAKITGFNESGDFTVTGFALSPAFSMSDPLRTGVNVSSSIYASPSSMATHFLTTNVYPLIYPVKWLNGYDYELGGGNGIGLYTKLQLINKMIAIEDFYSFNINNFDSFGIMAKLNPLTVSVASISAGVGIENMKYKISQSIADYNKYLFFDFAKRISPQSAFSEAFYTATGGFVQAEIMKRLTAFVQAKMTKTSATIADYALLNSLDGLMVYAGAMLNLTGLIAEVDVGYNSQALNTNTNVTKINSLTNYMSRDALEIKAKAYANYVIMKSTLNMNLNLLAEATYATLYDGMTGFSKYRNISLTSNFVSASGMELKLSAKVDFLNMISVRELFRYANINFNQTTNASPNISTIGEIESRTYVDVDLNRWVPGLSLTGGIRFFSYSLTNSFGTNVTPMGVAVYPLPYGEIRIVFGKDSDSFVKFTYGLTENYSVKGTAYGLGLDNGLKSSTLNMTTTGTPTLYDSVNYNMSVYPQFNFEFGLRL